MRILPDAPGSIRRERNQLHSLHGDRSVPSLDRRDAAVIAEDAQRRGIEEEVTSCSGWKADPPSNKDPKDVAVGKEDDVSFHRAHALDYSIHSNADVFRTFPSRATVLEEHPPRRLGMNLFRGQALVVAVVPFLEVAIDFGPLPQTGELAGLAGTLKGARENSSEGHLRKNRRQESRHRSAILRERDIRDAGVLSAQAPLGLTVSYEKNSLDRHTRRAQPMTPANALPKSVCASCWMRRKCSLLRKLVPMSFSLTLVRRSSNR